MDYGEYVFGKKWDALTVQEKLALYDDGMLWEYYPQASFDPYAAKKEIQEIEKMTKCGELYEEALNEYRWVDGKISEQAWLVQNGVEYVGQRKGACDMPITKGQGKDLRWIPIRKEWRGENFVKAKYF